MRAEKSSSILFIVVIVLAAAMRFTHLAWDGLLHTHPDERYILFTATALQFPEHAVDVLRPAYSPLNPFRALGDDGVPGTPRTYAYGHLPLYTMSAVHPIIAPLLRSTHPDAFEQLTLTGRGLSALADTLTVLVIGLLARHLYGRRAGWLAAAFGALAVLHIQQAHFATVDATLTLFVTLALWYLVRTTSGNNTRNRDGVLAGVCTGFAVGSKASGLLLIVPLVVAHLHREEQGWRVDRRLWLAISAMGASFGLTNPYALLDFPLFMRDIGTQAALMRGQFDWTFVRQFTGTLPIWYYVKQQALWGLGMPLTIAGYAGLGWATWQARSNMDGNRATLPLLIWAWLTLIVVGSQFVKFPRYMLPVTPMLFIFAAGLLRHRDGVRDAVAGLVLVWSALLALAFVRLYARPHPWLAASEWIYDTLPRGTTIAVERGDDALPLDLGPLHAAAHFEQRLLDPYAVEEDLTGFLRELAASDYFVLASNRLYGTVPRLDERFPAAAATYERLFAGELGFIFERLFSRYPDLFGLAVVDDTFARPGLSRPEGLEDMLPTPNILLGYADESLTVYDHPLVLIFRNEARLSVEEMEGVIADGS